MKKLFLSIIFILASLSSNAFAHSGGTDQYGCHAGSQPRHCHNGGTSNTREVNSKSVPWTVAEKFIFVSVLDILLAGTPAVYMAYSIDSPENSWVWASVISSTALLSQAIFYIMTQNDSKEKNCYINVLWASNGIIIGVVWSKLLINYLVSNGSEIASAGLELTDGGWRIGIPTINVIDDKIVVPDVLNGLSTARFKLDIGYKTTGYMSFLAEH